MASPLPKKEPLFSKWISDHLEYIPVNYIRSDFGGDSEKFSLTRLNLGSAICIHLWWSCSGLDWNTVVQVKNIGWQQVRSLISRQILTAANFPAWGPACKMVIRIAHLYPGNALTAGSAGPGPIQEGRWTWEQTWDAVAELGAVGGPWDRLLRWILPATRHRAGHAIKQANFSHQPKLSKILHQKIS